MRSVRRWIRQLRLGFVGSLATLALLLELPVSSRAEEPVTRNLDAVLEVHAGATCLNREHLLANIQMRLGHVPLQGMLRIVVTGDDSDKQRVTYAIRHNDWIGERQFQPVPESCNDLHAMLGRAIALALDVERMQDAWLVPPQGQHKPLLWTGQLSVSQGLLLGFAYGLQLGVDLRLTSLLHVRVDVLGQLARKNMLSNSRGRFDLWLPAAAFELCAGGQLQSTMRLALCSGALAGAVIGEPRGYAANNIQAGAWFGWRAGARFEALLGVRWLIDLDVVTRIYSPAVVVESPFGLPPQRRELPSVGFALSFGPALTF